MYKILYNKGMKVGVYCNRATKKFLSVRVALIEALRGAGIPFAEFTEVDAIGGVDVLVVLGGDGTILKVAIEAGRRGIRVLGINAGNLGFLTEFEGDQVQEAVRLLSGKYDTERRSVLEVVVNGNSFYALNEAVFQRRYEPEADDNVVAVCAEIDGKKVDEFVGDGIIISTPTGSTAYSLSAGGSILTPGIAAFILTPVCAHSLHNRPIVYADSSLLRVRLSERRAGVALYCDGKPVGDLHYGDKILLKKADFGVEFIKNKDSNFFDRLLFKLNKWSK